MKQFLKSALYALLLISPAATARHSSDCCVTPCNTTNNCVTNCNTGCNTFNTNCNTNCFDGCGTRNCNTNCNTNCNFNNCNTGCFNSSDCGRCSNNNDCGTNGFNCGSDCGYGYVHFRSQGQNLARNMVAWQHRFDYENNEINGVGKLVYEYQRSFRARNIGRALYGSNTLLFEGSAVAATGSRTPGAFVADYFGLPSTFRGSVSFCPRIENHIVEFDGYWNLGGCSEGPYFEFHAPIVFTRWSLNPNFCESTTSVTTVLPSCAFGATPTAAPSFCQAVTGNFFPGFCGGLVSTGCSSKTRLAQLDLILGYNFWNVECGHLGLYLIAIAPTGNKPCGDRPFEAVAGNGGLAEFGVGLTAHTSLWQDDCDQQLALYFEAQVTHMFKRRQCRTLDFCNNGAFSRFLLLREFAPDGVTPTGRLVPATCVNKRNVDVRIDVKGDAALKLAYRWCGFGLDLGYNIYGHSKERLSYPNDCNNCVTTGGNQYGIAGTTSVCCNTFPATFAGSCITVTGASTSTSLVNSTFSNATIFTPTTGSQPDNVVTPLTGTSVCLVPGVTPAVGTVIQNPTSTTPCLAASLPGTVVSQSSSRPNLVNGQPLSLQSAAACSVLSHKVFGNLSYTWADDCGYNPSLSVGGEGEFNGKGCVRPTLNQWGVWVQGVVNF